MHPFLGLLQALVHVYFHHTANSLCADVGELLSSRYDLMSELVVGLVVEALNHPFVHLNVAFLSSDYQVFSSRCLDGQGEVLGEVFTAANVVPGII